MIWINILLLLVGLYLTIFGILVTFRKGFVEKLRKGIWKEENEELWGRQGYTYDKYISGIKFLLLGLNFLGFGVYTMLKYYGIL